MLFSDREGIKVSIPSRRLQKAFPDTKTHIGCPRCQKRWPDKSHSVQVRHEGIVPVLSDSDREWVFVRQRLR